MNKKQSTPPKKRGATVAAVLCFVAAIAIAGTYTLGNSREARQKEEIARTEENAAKEKSNGDTEEKARATDGLVIQDSSDTGGAGEGGTLEKTPGIEPGQVQAQEPEVAQAQAKTQAPEQMTGAVEMQKAAARLAHRKPQEPEQR